MRGPCRGSSVGASPGCGPEAPTRVSVRRAAVYVSPKVGREHVERLLAVLGEGGVEVLEVREEGEPNGDLGADVVFVLGGTGRCSGRRGSTPGPFCSGLTSGGSAL